MEGYYLVAQDMCQQKFLCIYAHEHNMLSLSFFHKHTHTSQELNTKRNVMKHLINTADVFLPLGTFYLFFIF